MTVLDRLESYGKGFQIKIITSLMNNREFLLTIYDIIESDFFDNPADKWIVDKIINYYKTYKIPPTLEVLKIELKKVENDALSEAIAFQLLEVKKILKDELQVEDRDFLEKEFLDFCKFQHYKKFIHNSIQYLELGDLKTIESMSKSLGRIGEGRDIGHEYDKDTEVRYQQAERKEIPTPWEVINDLLLGGLGKGELGLVFGGPGSGKSWFLVNIAAAAAREGFTAYYYTLELPEYYVGKRFDSLFTGIDVRDLADRREEVDEAVSKLKGKLIIKEYPMKKASIASIHAHIQRSITLGNKTPDVIVIDYLDLLRNDRNYHERKEELDDIYAAARGMAQELGIPIWSASQLNRSAAQDNKTQADKIAGSYEKIAIADFGLGISRKDEDKANDEGRITVMKNRFGPDGKTYVASINTKNGNIQISDLEWSLDNDSSYSKPNKSTNNAITSEDMSFLQKSLFKMNM